MKIYKFLAAAVVTLILASCSGKSGVQYMPAKDDEHEGWGLIGADGEFLFEDEFDNCPSPAVNGIFYVKEGSGYSAYRAEKHPELIGDLTGLKYCGYYNEGLMPVVHKDEHITFVDDKGRTKFVLDKVDTLDVFQAMPMFMNGRCSFATSAKRWGVIDTNGNVVISPKYLSPIIFIEDYVIALNGDDERFVVLDRDGNETAVINEPLDHATVFHDGYAVAVKVNDDGAKWFTVNAAGVVKELPSSIIRVYGFNDKYIVYEDEAYKCGIMTVDGNVTVRPKYSAIYITANGKFLGQRESRCMMINPANGETEPLPKNTGLAIQDAIIWSKLLDFDFQLYSVNSDGEAELCKYNGKEVGDDFDRYIDNIEMPTLKSDDVDAIVGAVVAMFDNNGLKGFPFGAQMENFATAHPVQWYRNDKSLSLPLEYRPVYFDVNSATGYSEEPIAVDATPSGKFYSWSFNPESRLEKISLTLDFDKDLFRPEIATLVIRALNDKFGLSLTSGSNYYEPYNVTCSGQNCEIKIVITQAEWLGVDKTPVDEMPEETETSTDSIKSAPDSIDGMNPEERHEEFLRQQRERENREMEAAFGR